MIVSKEVNSLKKLYQFIQVRTPKEWLLNAKQNIELLLIDHAHCERKAATTALNLISKYPGYDQLVRLMSPLAREELLHFEKVLQIMNSRNIQYQVLQPCTYATSLHQQITRQGGPDRLRDQLILGAIIEARSCERFQSLVETLEDIELVRFYSTLVKSEARHFENYLALAHEISPTVPERVSYFLNLENRLILNREKVFRFHSGIPEN